MASSILYLYLESPLHAGTGSGLGTVDLPIQRERHTDYPLVQGSGIKGALRELATQGSRNQTIAKDDLYAVFGPETINAADHAGALTVGDARLLLFPVRSLRGVFAWTTAPLVLRRLLRDVAQVSQTPPTWQLDLADDDGEMPTALVSTASGVMLQDESVVLEEYTFRAQPDAQVDALAMWLRSQLVGLDAWWAQRLMSHLVVLPDSVFRDFVLHSTEIVTRVKLQTKTKTVQEGALWTEENLPTDTLLYCPLMSVKPRRSAPTVTTDTEVLTFVANVANNVFQLGGNETVGRGFVRPFWSAEVVQ
jgi:CRISPR-associated protein Cmr4